MLKIFLPKALKQFPNSLLMLFWIVCRVILISTIASFVLVVNGQRQQRSVYANDYPGQDIGAKINAADKALGQKSGEIVIKGGGTISSQVVISSDHVLRLMPGTYATTTSTIPIV